LIYIIANKKEKESVATKSYMIILALITISLSLTLPYLYLQYLPALFVLFLIAILFRKYIYTGYIRHLVIILVISILGFFVAFGHVFLQTKILKRATSFPAMELTYLENGEIIKTDNYKINNTSDESKTDSSPSTNKNSNLTKLTSKIKNNEIFSGYINPMFNVAWNAMMIKNIRMPDNILSLGAYLWILLSIILIPISIIKKNWMLLTIMAFSLVFGLSTQLGILEVSTYRGRSGWYLMFLTSIGAIFIADYIITKKLDSKKIILPLIAILGVMGIIKPPVYYRPYYTEPYSIIKKAINDSPQASFNIITRDKHIGVLSDNLSIKMLSADSIREPCGKDICLIVIEKELMVVDPILSQQALAIDKNFQTFNQLQNEARAKNQIQIQEIKAMPQFSSYKLYWSNEKIDIYEYRKL